MKTGGGAVGVGKAPLGTCSVCSRKRVLESALKQRKFVLNTWSSPRMVKLEVKQSWTLFTFFLMLTPPYHHVRVANLFI